MIKEISLNELKERYEPDAVYIICTESVKGVVWQANYQKCSILEPDNVNEYRSGLLTQVGFETKYKAKLKSPIVKEYIQYLKSLENPVYLVTGIDYGFLARNI